MDEDVELQWNKMLDALVTRFERRNNEELKHILTELTFLLRAIRGKHGSWNSVIDIISSLMIRDVNIQTLKRNLGYNESTIYRALNHLTNIKFAKCVRFDSQKIWTIDRENFPVLYRARQTYYSSV